MYIESDKNKFAGIQEKKESVVRTGQINKTKHWSLKPNKQIFITFSALILMYKIIYLYILLTHIFDLKV